MKLYYIIIVLLCSCSHYKMIEKSDLKEVFLSVEKINMSHKNEDPFDHDIVEYTNNYSYINQYESLYRALHCKKASISDIKLIVESCFRDCFDDTDNISVDKVQRMNDYSYEVTWGRNYIEYWTSEDLIYVNMKERTVKYKHVVILLDEKLKNDRHLFLEDELTYKKPYEYFTLVSNMCAVKLKSNKIICKEGGFVYLNVKLEALKGYNEDEGYDHLPSIEGFKKKRKDASRVLSLWIRYKGKNIQLWNIPPNCETEIEYFASYEEFLATGLDGVQNMELTAWVQNIPKGTYSCFVTFEPQNINGVSYNSTILKSKDFTLVVE